MTETTADPDQVALGRRLRETREYLGLSQQHVTAGTGIPRTAISEIERGNRRVDSLELRRLARFFRYPVSYFYGEEPDQTETTAVLGRVLNDLEPEDREQILRFAQYLTFTGRTRKPGDGAP